MNTKNSIAGYLKAKFIMWYKVKEAKSQGFNKTQTGRILGIHRSTVRHYLTMSEDEFIRKSRKRGFPAKLLPYEGYVHKELDKYPFLSVPQIHDRLKKAFPDMPEICEKTVFNFVKELRRKYNIPKTGENNLRSYEKLPDTPYGQFAQMDFGESRIMTDKGKPVKVYFFAIVLSRTRYKYVYFSRTPFNTAWTVYAHELAFSFFGGKPQKILYDQDKVLISSENLGDVLLTKGFRSFVNEQHFQPVFCRKADPESKGKIENVVKYVKRNFLRGRTFRTVEELNAEVVEWLQDTGNGKIHGTTFLIPAEEFEIEKEYLTPYHGIPTEPKNEMKEYHVRKDNTIQYHGSYYSVPYGTYRSSATTLWLQETDGMVELYDKETGKLTCKHKVCPQKGKNIYRTEHHRPPSTRLKEMYADVLKHTAGDKAVSLWLENLKKDKPRYYRANLKSFMRTLSDYAGQTVIEAVKLCLDKGIYNALSLDSVCRSVQKSRKDLPGFPASMSGPPSIRPENDNIKQYEKIVQDDTK